MLLHAREGHTELLGKVRDRSVGTSELLQNAASGGIRERGERVIEAGLRILNHMVQYTDTGSRMQGEAEPGHLVEALGRGLAVTDSLPLQQQLASLSS